MPKPIQTMPKERFFGGWTDFWRPLFWVALPIVFQNLVSSSLHIIDNLMVGALGDGPLAGVTQANQLQFVLRLFMFGTASGASILIAQRWGSQDIAGLRRAYGIGLCSTMILGGCGMLFGILCPRVFLNLYIHDEITMGYSLDYIRRVAPSYLFLSVTMMTSMANKSTERAILPMLASVAGIGTNTFLNWCLIYGHLGLPELGVKGAAIATSIAAGLEMVILVAGTWLKKYPAAGTLRSLIPGAWSEIRAFYKIAAPVILNEGMWGAGTSVYNIVYGLMGTVTVAAMSIFGVMDQVIWAVGWGFMSASAVLVGKRLGADDIPGAIAMARRMLAITVAAGLSMGFGVVLPLSGLAPELFNVSAAAREMASKALMMLALLLFIKMFNSTNIVGVLRSGGDTLFTMWLDTLGVWLIGVPMAFLGGVVLQLPLHWVFLMIQTEEVVKAFFGIRRFLSRKWARRLALEDRLTAKNEV